MFHAINTWLARQARRVHDARLARENQIAQAVVDNGWQLQVAGFSTWRYRDPRFGTRQACSSIGQGTTRAADPIAAESRWPR